MTPYAPYVIERSSRGEKVYDIFSRLLKERIIFVGDTEGGISTASANNLIAQLLYLSADDPEKEINL